MNSQRFMQRYVLGLLIILLSFIFFYATTFAQNNPDIRIELVLSTYTAKVGETVTYTITITNNGSSNLTNVKLNAPRLGIVDSAIYGGNVSRGAVGIIQGTFTVQESDLPGPLAIVATVRSDQTGSPSAVASVTINGHYATPEIDPIYIGQTATWLPIRACDRKCLQWELYQTNQTGDWEIFKLDAQATNPVNISNSIGQGMDDIAPSRSPNGEWVTFSSNRDGNWEIYIARNDGTSLQRVTENAQAIDINPVWGPNNYIVYQSNRDSDWNLYLFDTVTGVETRLTDSTADDINPTWSPDGVNIAFQTNRDKRWQIYSIQPHSGALTQLSNGDRNDFEPVYSPDGRNIAFRSVLDGKTTSNVFVMGAQGGSIIPVTNFEGDASHPSWSANSKLLAYQSSKDGDQEIYVYDMASGETRQITDNKANDYAPAFLCDGTALLYTSDEGGKADIYQVDVAAPDQPAKRLTTGDGDNLFPQDGGKPELSSSAVSIHVPVGTAGRPAYPTIELAPGALEPLYPRMSAWTPINACAKDCSAGVIYTGKIGQNWQILKQDNDTKQIVNLSKLTDGNTNPAPDNVMPSVSPNGQWLVFVSNRDKYWELDIASTDGRVPPRRVTFTKQTERNPVWSPGGQSILYESNRDGNWELYRMEISTGAEERLTFNDSDDTYPRWSPDASRIVFQSNRSRHSQIYLLDLQTQLITKLSDGQGEDSQAVFAADGRHIAFRSVRPGSPNGVIWVKDVFSGSAMAVSDPAQDAAFPEWSGTGLILAYQAGAAGSQSIYAYDVDTGTTQQLIDGGVNAYAPSWDCDGRKLVVNVGMGDAAHIYVLDDAAALTSPITALDGLTALSTRTAATLYNPFIDANDQLWDLKAP